jgi:hypothetical protein
LKANGYMSGFHKSKKEKTTFGEVVVVGILLLIFDGLIWGSSLRSILYGLGVLELIGIGALVLRAIWDSLPKGVQKGLSNL